MPKPPADHFITSFPMVSTVDCCSVWNIICSQTLALAAKLHGHHFILADYVRYECLVKPRSAITPLGAALREKLQGELSSGKFFSVAAVSVEDLREVAAHVGQTKAFHQGEFAALALANKLGNGFITDDQRARSVGERVLGVSRVRTTPHLVGWLVYIGRLTDSDVPQVISDNTEFSESAFYAAWGRLAEFIRVCYEHAMGLRLREHIARGHV